MTEISNNLGKSLRKQRPKHAKNPFMEEVLSVLTDKVKTKRKWSNGNKGAQINLVTQEGEVVGETVLMTVHKVDTEQFTKIFSCKVGNMFSMPRGANKVFQHILCNLEKDQDKIYLYDGELKDVIKLSSKSIYRSIQFLVDNEFIAKSTSPYWYFINPTLFFNGNRLALTEIYEKDVKLDNKVLHAFPKQPLKQII